MNNQQPQWSQEQPQHTWSSTNRGWSPPQPANTLPSRQFKRPLSLPPHGQQQYRQAQWGQQSSQHHGQLIQPQRPPLSQLSAHPQSPLSQPSSRHFKHWPWLILGIVALVVLFASIGVRPLASEGNTTPQTAMTSQVGQSSQPPQSQPGQQAATQPASQPTALPTQAQALQWMNTHTFTGQSQEKKTTTFTVGNSWKILWTCNPGTIFGGLGTIIVNVYSSDGTFQHGAINDTCQAGHTTGNTIEQQGGNIYLDITGGGNWVVQVQELK